MNIYICPECKKTFKVNGENKKVRCNKCSEYLTDINLTTDEWEALDNETKRTKLEDIGLQSNIEKQTEKMVEENSLQNSFFTNIEPPRFEEPDPVHIPQPPKKRPKKSFGHLYAAAAVCLIISFILLCIGFSKKHSYHNSEYSPQNAYVGGDAYNYIINAGYSTGYYVLSAGFGLAGVITGCTYVIATEINNME